MTGNNFDLGREDSKKLILATYLETHSIKETASRLNYTFSWVYKVLCQLNVVSLKPKKHKVLTKNLDSKTTYSILSDYLKAVPTQLILDGYNISSSTLYYLLDLHKIPRRNPKTGLKWSQLSKEDKAYLSAGVICAAFKQKTDFEIAKIFNIPVSRVQIILATLKKPPPR